MKKIAIIGASTGQLGICLKAKDMGLYTICFAWEEGAVCKDIVDKFYPISIFEMDKIVNICKKEKIDGVVSNGSDATTRVVSYISEKLGLHGNKYSVFEKASNKYFIRQITRKVQDLEQINYVLYQKGISVNFPCVVKPCIGGGKKGVCYAENLKQFNDAVAYASIDNNIEIIVEDYIFGLEVSVESISFEGKHIVVQITDKESTGAPHFVELGHHQPSLLSTEIKEQIKKIVPDILSVIGFENGASHVELKIDKNGHIYLIEVNMRGGGDEISNQLVYLSTGFDYIKAMINVALGCFCMPTEIKNIHFSGVYFLCSQTRELLSLFLENNNDKDIVEKKIVSTELFESTTNYDRNGYLIYQSDTKLSYSK